MAGAETLAELEHALQRKLISIEDYFFHKRRIEAAQGGEQWQELAPGVRVNVVPSHKMHSIAPSGGHARGMTKQPTAAVQLRRRLH